MRSLQQIKIKILKKWQKTFLPCGLVDENTVFPYRFPLPRVTNQYMLDNWQEVKQNAQDYLKLKNTTVEWRTFRTPLGEQKLPTALVFSSVEQLANWLQLTSELDSYRAKSQQITNKFVQLTAWCLKNPLKILKHKHSWNKLLIIIDWFLANPQSQIYLREISLPEIDSKFIEQHKKLLNELLLIIQASDGKEDSGNLSFEAKWGIKSKPDTLRLRFLGSQNIAGLRDIQAPISDWQKIDLLSLGIEKIFITENEINFLAFPQQENAVVIFGKGYGFLNWHKWQSLLNLPISYWGDIDTHGFAILNQLRQQLPQTKSMLMDEKTLLKFKFFWGVESKPTKVTLVNLTPEEQQLYQDLITNYWAKNLRLEQERISLPMKYSG